MICKSIYEILLLMEGDIYPTDDKNTRRVIDNWQELMRSMIYRLEEVAEVKGDSDNINFSADRAKTALVDIRTQVEHIIRRIANEI